MKTLQIARGIAGVLSLVGVTGLVGCGAETGAPEAQIGSTSEALSVAGGTALSTAVKSPAHCKMVDGNGKEYFALFGGFTTSSGSPTDAIQLYTVAGGWALPKLSSDHTTTAVLSTQKGQAQAVPVPGDAASCLVVGGSATFDGSALADDATHFNVEKVTVDTSGELTVTHVSGLNNFAQLARTRGALSACNSGNLVFYFGGKDDSGTLKNTVMSFDVSAPANAWAAVDVNSGTAGTQNMADSHMDFGLVREIVSSNADFVVAGGEKSGGTSDKIELFKTTSSCSSWTTATGTLSGTNPERKGPALVLKAAGDYVVAGGARSTTVFGNTTNFVVDWTGTNPSFSTSPTAGTALANSAVTYRPSYLSLGTTGLVLGGKVGTTSTSDSFATDAVQETYWSSANLANNGRWEAAAEVLDVNGTNKVHLAGGEKVVSGTATVLSTMELVTP